MESITADRVIDEEESRHLCYVLDQWTAQMTDAQDYVKDYKKDDPDIMLNSGLGNLEEEAERALDILSEVEWRIRRMPLRRKAGSVATTSGGQV